MRKILVLVLIQSMIIILLCGCYKNETGNLFSEHYTQKSDNNVNNIIVPSGNTIETRFAVPYGYKRIEFEKGSLAHFLRNYEMKTDGSPVLLYDGREKNNQDAHAAVFALPIENADLQQCADSVMRVYAEYYRSVGQEDKISFYFTNGFLCEYSKWKDGYRINQNGNETKWKKSAEAEETYENFVKYMRIIFSYAGTASMEKYETHAIKLSEMEPGDVILKGGSPGHVVMVTDVCINDSGNKAFLLAQGYMPAQEFHVIKNPAHEDDPWYYENEMEFPLKTAEYTFDDENMIKRLLY